MTTLIRICPFTQTVDEVEYNGDYLTLARNPDAHIRAPDGSGSGLFQIVSYGSHDLIIDDEGLFQGWPSFTTQLWPHGALTGRCLISHADNKGNTIAPTLTRNEVAQMVTWDQPTPEPSFTISAGPRAFSKMGLS